MLLCLLWAVASLRSDLLPGSIPEANSSPLLNQASILALFAIIAAATAFVRKANWPRGRSLLGAVLIGVGLLALPALLRQFAKGHVDDSTRVALFSLVPVFAVVLEPYLGSASQSPQRGGLAAALVAVAGTVLIFPLDLPRTPASRPRILRHHRRGRLCRRRQLHRSKDRTEPNELYPCPVSPRSPPDQPQSCSPLPACRIGPRAWSVAHIDAWVIPDLLALALLFWLLRRMSAVRMTTRFLIAPLMANLIALAFLRPGVQPRAWLGLLLIALASGWLLFAPEDEPEKTGSPLGIT